jgi:hypothetical protein
MVLFSQGLPVIAHEIGDATVSITSKGKIGLFEATHGINKAARVIGGKYLEPKILGTIRSNEYRRIFRKIVYKVDFNQDFTKSELANFLSSEERKSLSNFLNKMKKLGVIKNVPGAERGIYRFVNLIHWIYFYMVLDEENSKQSPAK